MPAGSELEKEIRAAGLRVTRPRVAVLSAVGSNPHADASTIIELARAEAGRISHQTVYNALRALNESGLVRQIQPTGSAGRYESRVDDNHHHVVCRRCGAIADVDCAVGARPCLNPSDDHGYVIDEAEVVFRGICPDCSTASAPHQPERPRRESDVR